VLWGGLQEKGHTLRLPARGGVISGETTVNEMCKKGVTGEKGLIIGEISKGAVAWEIPKEIKLLSILKLQETSTKRKSGRENHEEGRRTERTGSLEEKKSGSKADPESLKEKKRRIRTIC